jgi:hypothetical protein
MCKLQIIAEYTARWLYKKHEAIFDEVIDHLEPVDDAYWEYLRNEVLVENRDRRY